MTKLNRRKLMKSRVFRGWIDPFVELPKRVDERTTILFGNTKWHPLTDKRCKITVEWEA